MTNIKGTIHGLTAQLVETDCVVSFKCPDCELTRSGSLSLEMLEPDSVAADILVKISSNSSIPGENSSISSLLLGDTDKYFRGPNPSTFYILLTPWVFINDSEDWDKGIKGYHASQIKDPEKGSQIPYSQ